jgi:hypothetical protein
MNLHAFMICNPNLIHRELYSKIKQSYYKQPFLLYLFKHLVIRLRAMLPIYLNVGVCTNPKINVCFTEIFFPKLLYYHYLLSLYYLSYPIFYLIWEYLACLISYIFLTLYYHQFQIANFVDLVFV